MQHQQTQNYEKSILLKTVGYTILSLGFNVLLDTSEKIFAANQLSGAKNPVTRDSYC